MLAILSRPILAQVSLELSLQFQGSQLWIGEGWAVAPCGAARNIAMRYSSVRMDAWLVRSGLLSL